MPIESAKLAASDSEQGIQRAILNEVMLKTFPITKLAGLIYHVPNGGYRGDAKSAAIAGANLAAMGAKAGVPDLCLPVCCLGYGALYVEVKTPKGKLSKTQISYINELKDGGSFIAIVDDWLTGFNVIHDYLTTDIATFTIKYKQGKYPNIYDPSDHFK